MSPGGLIYFLTCAHIKLATSVTSIKNIGLATDGITDLNSFAAAAGYTDASAVLDNIGDPEFVWNGWATAEVAVSLFALRLPSACLKYINSFPRIDS